MFSRLRRFQTPKCGVVDLRIAVKPWGFCGATVMDTRSGMGELDTLVFPSSANYLAASLSNHSLHMIPGAGHLTVIARHANAILRSCCRRADAQWRCFPRERPRKGNMIVSGLQRVS